MSRLPIAIDKNTLIVCNHSGGKDSQALYRYLEKAVPQDQLIVVHADLGEMEWDGVQAHIRATINHPLHVVRAKKTFVEMVEHRGMFPSTQFRQCTSDLKRSPINTFVRRYANQHGYTTVLNATGIRAEESSNRAKKDAFKINAKETNSKRTWYEWLPIFTYTLADVLASEGHTVEELNFRREVYNDLGMKECALNEWKFHHAYVRGMSRLSCCFCIMASKHDLKVSARENPEKFARMVALEKKVNHSLVPPRRKNGELEVRFLDEIIAQ